MQSMRQPLNLEQRSAAFMGVGGGVVHPVCVREKCVVVNEVFAKRKR